MLCIWKRGCCIDVSSGVSMDTRTYVHILLLYIATNEFCRFIYQIALAWAQWIIATQHQHQEGLKALESLMESYCYCRRAGNLLGRSVQIKRWYMTIWFLMVMFKCWLSTLRPHFPIPFDDIELYYRQFTVWLKHYTTSASYS